MNRLKIATIIGVIFVIAAGSLAHFLYHWLGEGFIIGLFTPVNESVWEHMKLLFFPMLIYSFLTVMKIRKTYPCAAPSFCFGILAGTFLIPILFYLYTSILGQDVFLLDIGIFVLSTAAAFYAAYRFTLSCRLESYGFLFCGLVFVLFFCFILFTYYPPGLEIFSEPY